MLSEQKIKELLINKIYDVTALFEEDDLEYLHVNKISWLNKEKWSGYDETVTHLLDEIYTLKRILEIEDDKEMQLIFDNVLEGK